MTDYKAIYRCRLCGERFKDCETGNEAITMASVCGITSKEYFYPKGSDIGLHRTAVHNCPDGSLGFADFLGFEKWEDK